MQFLGQESGGAIALGPASFCTTIRKLVAAGLISGLDGDGPRRIYCITPTGNDVLISNVERRRQMLAMAERILEEARVPGDE